MTYNRKAYLYLLPSLTLATVFFIMPALSSAFSSFFSPGGYISLFKNRYFLLAVRNTLTFTFLFIPINTLFPLVLATLTRKDDRMSLFFRNIYIIPLSFSLALIAVVFRKMFSNSGIISRTLGLDFSFLDSPSGSFASLVLLSLFLDVAINYIILYSSFRSIDKSIIEMALIDGAAKNRLFFSIEIPLIKKAVLLVLALGIKDALLISSPIMILTSGGPFRSTESIMFFYYVEAFSNMNYSYANSISTLMLSLSISSSLFFAKRRKHD